MAGVLILARGSVAAAFAGRLVTDAGFAVTRVVTEDEDRTSVFHEWLTSGQDVRVVDMVTAKGRQECAALIAGAGAIIADPWGAELVAHARPSVPVVELARAESAALLQGAERDEFLAFHGSGPGYLTPRMMPGYPSAEPLVPKAHLVQFMIGLYGAIALLALLRRGGGVRAQVGIAGAVLPLLRREVAAVLFQGQHPHRNERIWRVSPAEVHRCRDGWVFVDVIEDSQWVKLCDMIGRPDLAAHADFATRDLRFDHADAVCEVLDAYFAGQMKTCWREAQARGVPVAPVNDLDDLWRDEQLAARGFWKTFAARDGRALHGPRTPLAGIFAPGSARIAAGQSQGAAPLSGVRVVELTHVWSGPLCGQILCDLGAEVIRVESRDRLDIHRRGGPYPEGQAGINRSGTWNAQNRGKLGCTMDLKHQEGRRLFRDLVACCDVVVENFAPGALARLGLDFAELRKVNPKIVLLSLSGFGQTGPDRGSLAYGPMMDAATGLSALTAYDDGIPRAVNGWAADIGGALHGCLGVLRALHQDEREAVHLDISQFEAGTIFAASRLMARANRAAAEDGVTRLIGESAERDRWVAAIVTDASERAALATLLGGADFASWVRARARDQAVLALRAAGIGAVPVATIEEMLADEDLARAGCWREQNHPEAGVMRNYAPPIHVAGAVENLAPAPCLGQHNRLVYCGMLGRSAREVEELAERGII